MKKIILIPALIFLFMVIVLVNQNFRNKFSHISGIVTSVYEDGTKDAVFRLKGYEGVFYINRGLEKTFSLDNLSEKLKGKEVTILYPDSWTPLGSIAQCWHISELRTNEETVYSEFTAD